MPDTATTTEPRVFYNADPPGLTRVRDTHGNTWTYQPGDTTRSWKADNVAAVIAADPALADPSWSGLRSFGLLCWIYGPLTEIVE